MLKQKIQSDLKSALKEGKREVCSVLRLFLASILSKEKEKRYKIAKSETNLIEKELIEKSALTDEEIVEVLFSEIKKRKEAILEYQKGRREDLAKKEKSEMEILQKYLPEQLSEEEIKKLAKEAVNKIGAKEIKDMGKVMAELMPKVKGKVDGSSLSRAVKNLLSSQPE